MKAISISGSGGLGQLTVEERPSPSPKQGEILVKWHASSLNYHDYLVALGGLPVEKGRIPMSDGAGEILAVGAGVTQWKVGDKVMSLFFPNWIEGKPTRGKTTAIAGESVDGCAVQEAILKEDSVTVMPDNYTYAEAATLPCAALTAWRGLIVEGGMQAGDTVLVEGTGGMSIFALQIAVAAGAKVYATTSSPEKAERLLAMGACEVLNYREDKRWGRTLFKKMGGVDHVLDVGGGATFAQSIEAVAIGGHICSIGLLDGPKGEIVFPKLFFKQIRITGLAVGSREMQEAMVRAINISKMKPIIDKQFAMENIADAFRYQESGKHFGKIVVEF